VLLTMDPQQPEPWLVARAAAALRRGGVVVLPTDTVYGLTCTLSDPGAADRLCEVKGIASTKRLSLLLPDLASASRYARSISNSVFRMMRRVLPGPYTFIFPASGEVPRVMLRRRRTVGIRIPDCPITQAVLAELGDGLLSTSVRNTRDELILDPAVIEEELRGHVALVVDGGLLANEPSTIVDFTDSEPRLLREGKGNVAALGLFE
jgi:tRNA threonylcarbamoyl adenosine modification protein (Sua5/YciO/YrdC/YwlC family)